MPSAPNSDKITKLNLPPASASVHSIAELADKQLIDGAERAALEQVASRFSVAITPAMLDLIDPTSKVDPIALQFVPATAELRSNVNDVIDPIGDQTHTPVPGIVHRYPDRLLLTPIKVCPVYCRFCFRRETVGNAAEGMLSETELATALNYIRAHSEIWEVILSGGDPLLLSPRRLQIIMQALNEIAHVRVVRIHTRVPVVSPERITKQLTATLKIDKAVYVVLHSNHPRELTDAAKVACAQLIDRGIPMLSQSVLIKGVNNDAATLEALMRTLVENRIKPYYLHHADRATGTAHFRTSIAEGQQLMTALRGKVSGLCQPEYVLDIPGGAGKVPVGPAWIEQDSDSNYRVHDYQGETHNYHDTDI